jgi:hypothetical protein
VRLRPGNGWNNAERAPPSGRVVLDQEVAQQSLERPLIGVVVRLGQVALRHQHVANPVIPLMGRMTTSKPINLGETFTLLTPHGDG